MTAEFQYRCDGRRHSLTVVFAVRGLGSSRGNIGNIAASAGLSDGNARSFLAWKEVGEEFLV